LTGSTPIRYFPGLNGLRFIAAFFVLISHAHQSAVKLGMVAPAMAIAVFERGGEAVDVFFTLSGFLITYLLLRESFETGKISLRNFYLRRVCRIWPLYYLILLIGFILFVVVYPRVYGTPYFDFRPQQGFALYILFLPNVMIAWFKVGLLFPLWSVGVEEQFYLFWAPFVKLFRRRLWMSIAFFTVAVAVLQIVTAHRDSVNSHLATLIRTLRFHYMGLGALFALALFANKDRLVHSWVTSLWFQTLTIAVLLYHFVIGLPPSIPPAVLDLPLAFLYASLIINVSVAPRRILDLEWNPLNYLGRISYGIYMFHMTVDYCLRAVAMRLHPEGAGAPAALAYGAVLLLGTVAVAHVSYRYMETRFLALAKR
jgi:peptidoglycan/LPS O-acetylase OafA/YrhL